MFWPLHGHDQGIFPINKFTYRKVITNLAHVNIVINYNKNAYEKIWYTTIQVSSLLIHQPKACHTCCKDYCGIFTYPWRWHNSGWCTNRRYTLLFYHKLYDIHFYFNLHTKFLSLGCENLLMEQILLMVTF